MILYLGPLVLGLVLGFVLGSRIKENPESEMKYGASVYAIFIIAAIIFAYMLGPFPYYKDLPLASGFVATAVGIILGKLVLGRNRTPNQAKQ